jgi:DNA polymerase
MSQLDLFGEQTPEKSAREQGQAVQLSREPDANLPAEDRERLLAEVREPALKCTKCKLATTRTQVVFGEGSAATPLIFIGEGPGETEDATGRPFVGRAGKLLDEALRENGMLREHVYIANIVKCRPVVFEGGRHFTMLAM